MNRFNVGKTVAVLSILTASNLAACDKAKGPMPSVFPTPEWSASTSLLLRTDEMNPKVLLVKALSDHEYFKVAYDRKPLEETQALAGIVYQYDSSVDKLTRVAESVWDNTKGEIRRSLGGPYEFELRVDSDKNVLLYKDQIVPTVGKTALAVALSPGFDLVAVLSAAGKRSASLMPFLGQGGASGQHYHQLFRLPGMTPVGKPIPLALTSERMTLRPIWSADQRYVVYTYVYVTKLCIVPVELAGGPTS